MIKTGFLKYSLSQKGAPTGEIIQKFLLRKSPVLLMTALPHSMKKGILFTIQEIILLKIH